MSAEDVEDRGNKGRLLDFYILVYIHWSCRMVLKMPVYFYIAQFICKTNICATAICNL